MTLRVRHFWLSIAVLAVALVAASTASATRFHPAGQYLPSFRISEATARAAQATPTCGPFVCYLPSFIKEAYDFPAGRKGPTGAGQTIVVVTSFGSPTIAGDLAQFSAENGLPAPTTRTFKELDQVAPAVGLPAPDEIVFNWMVETTLDVEYAHAMAPGARIVVAVAATDDAADVAQVLREVLPGYPGSIVTQSFGVDENLALDMDPVTVGALQSIYRAHVQTGGTVLAASGDFGAGGYSPMYADPPFATAAYPASSPLVLAVGGTMGGDYPGGLWDNGHYGSEQAWNEPDVGGASGGAPSTIFSAPWQLGLTGTTKRAVPDVSFNAASNGGVVIGMTIGDGFHHAIMGGTSASTPQWAAIIALANELRGKQGGRPLGLATPQLFSLARDRSSYRQDFHDITAGNNALFGDLTQMPGFAAGRGYDFATGLGTPSVSRLLKDLAGSDNHGFDGQYGSEDEGGRDHNHGGHGRKHLKVNLGG